MGAAPGLSSEIGACMRPQNICVYLFSLLVSGIDFPITEFQVADTIIQSTAASCQAVTAPPSHWSWALESTPPCPVLHSLGPSPRLTSLSLLSLHSHSHSHSHYLCTIHASPAFLLDLGCDWPLMIATNHPATQATPHHHHHPPLPPPQPKSILAHHQS